MVWASAQLYAFVLQVFNASLFDVEEQSLSVPIGSQEFEVIVRLRYALDVSRFDVRFVKTEHGGNEDAYLIHLEGIEDAETPRTSVNDLITRPDAKGGMLGMWDPPNAKGSGDGLRLKIKMNCRKPWSGHLSFQGHDIFKELRCSRKRFTVITTNHEAIKS